MHSLLFLLGFPSLAHIIEQKGKSWIRKASCFSHVFLGNTPYAFYFSKTATHTEVNLFSQTGSVYAETSTSLSRALSTQVLEIQHSLPQEALTTGLWGTPGSRNILSSSACSVSQRDHQETAPTGSFHGSSIKHHRSPGSQDHPYPFLLYVPPETTSPVKDLILFHSLESI